MISTACRCGLTNDPTEGIGSIRFIGGFPHDLPVAACPYPCGHRGMIQISRLRLLLATKLVEASSCRNVFPNADSRRLREGLKITSDRLGAPHLVFRGVEGPGISFSYSSETIWAALCGNEYRCGIDAACNDDFSSDYPFHRAFCSGEMENFLPVTNGDAAAAAALAWSAKEAVVKAFGCAFHLMDPLDVQVEFFGSSGEAILLTADVNPRIRERFFERSHPAITLAAVLVKHTWVSLAVTSRKSVLWCEQVTAAE